jgi:hypothetical protein
MRTTAKNLRERHHQRKNCTKKQKRRKSAIKRENEKTKTTRMNTNAVEVVIDEKRRTEVKSVHIYIVRQNLKLTIDTKSTKENETIRIHEVAAERINEIEVAAEGINGIEVEVEVEVDK